MSLLEDNINKIDHRLINGSDLAYIGDAFYELWVRTYLISKGITKPNELHKETLKYVTSQSHYKIMKVLNGILKEDEVFVYHRGRNYNYKHKPKSAKISEYLASSGFEAVIGYLYLKQDLKRLDCLLLEVVRIINEGEDDE